MTEQKIMNRWWVVLGAVLIQLALGAIYAWSVFTPGLKATMPRDIALTYRAGMLELSAEDDAAMRAQLQAPRKLLGETVNRLKVADGDEAARLKLEKGRIEGDMDIIVRRYVSGDTLKKLTYGFTNSQTQAIFSAGLAFFAIVMVLAGRMMPKIGPRVLAMAGGVVLGAGYVLAGLAGGKSFGLHLLYIGIIGGSGIGLGYVVPIAVAMRWFPDKKGMITGAAVAGFGFGAMLWVKLAGQWGALIPSLGLPTTFVIYGIVFLVMVVVGGLWMAFPPDGWKPAGWTPPEPGTGSAAAGTTDLSSSQMLRTSQFYRILLTFAFGASAGLMSIGLMKLFPMQALTARGLSVGEASAVAGTAMAVFFSLANGIGRIAWGTISDKIGRKASIIIMMLTQGIVVIAFQRMAGTPVLLYVGATLIGFNFGGNFALFPTITADTFGTKHVGQNYGWVFLAYGIGGIFGPMLGGKLGDMNNFPLAFTVCGVLCLAAAAMIMTVKPPKAQAA